MVYGKLHKSIVHLQWNNVEETLSTKNGVEMTKETFKEDLPLHMAVERRAPDHVLMSLLEANKEAASIPGKSGSLPLHSAAQQCLSPNIIVALIKAYPEGLDVLNNSQYTPRDFHQRNEFALEALMRPTACWVEDVEKEEYTNRVRKRRLALREKIKLLQDRLSISKERIDSAQEIISDVKPLLEEQQEVMKKDKLREERANKLRNSLKKRMIGINERITKLEQIINNEKCAEETMINTVLKRTYMEEAKKKYEKATQSHLLIQKSLKALIERLSEQKDSSFENELEDFDLYSLTLNLF